MVKPALPQATHSLDFRYVEEAKKWRAEVQWGDFGVLRHFSAHAVAIDFADSMPEFVFVQWRRTGSRTAQKPARVLVVPIFPTALKENMPRLEQFCVQLQEQHADYAADGSAAEQNKGLLDKIDSFDDGCEESRQEATFVLASSIDPVVGFHFGRSGAAELVSLMASNAGSKSLAFQPLFDISVPAQHALPAMLVWLDYAKARVALATES